MSDSKETLTAAYGEVLKVLQDDLGWDRREDVESMDGSAERAAKALLDMIHNRPDVEAKVADILRKRFPARSNTSVRQTGLTTSFLCPHHLLPVVCDISVSYLVTQEHGAIGLSKVQRIATLLGKGPVLQEDYTADLASALALVGGKAVARTTAIHTCMACRGILAPNIRTECEAERKADLNQIERSKNGTEG